jgi:formylglycine-generating enzyme required for sulfatase activity
MRSAFVAASVVLLVSGVSLADDSPAVPPVAKAPPAAVPSVHTESAAVQELQAEAARVAAALSKAEKAVAAAAMALPGVTKQRKQCEESAKSTKANCEDSCEETMRRCRAANHFRSNAAAACEERGDTCTSNCGATATKICAELNAKEEKLAGVVKAPDALRSELEGIERSIRLEARREASAAEAAAQAAAQAAAEAAAEAAAKAAPMAVIPAGSVEVKGVGTKEVASFSIDVTEVTVDAYAACVRAGNCSKPNAASNWVRECHWGKSDRGNHPVNCVDWKQAKAFCGWAQKRLPTEQEWQLAAESAQGRTYPWGEAAPSNQLCWQPRDDFTTCAVGSFPAGDSAQGVKDLSGNVYEWTDSCHDLSCYSRVDRGGIWSLVAPSVRAADRRWDDPSRRSVDIGFRCSRSN